MQVRIASIAQSAFVSIHTLDEVCNYRPPLVGFT